MDGGQKRIIPKSEWGEGPWQAEPDRYEFSHQGFPCLAVRSDFTGAWCGYVAVPPGHPAYERRYEQVDVTAHGGLTYSDHCQGHICHEPEPGQSDKVWWLGFDCAHCDDVQPALRASLRILSGIPNPLPWGTYRTLEYVKKEIYELADQLAAMEKTNGRNRKTTKLRQV